MTSTPPGGIAASQLPHSSPLPNRPLRSGSDHRAGCQHAPGTACPARRSRPLGHIPACFHSRQTELGAAVVQAGRRPPRRGRRALTTAAPSGSCQGGSRPPAAAARAGTQPGPPPGQPRRAQTRDQQAITTTCPSRTRPRNRQENSLDSKRHGVSRPPERARHRRERQACREWPGSRTRSHPEDPARRGRRRRNVNPAPAHAGQDRDRSSARRGCLTMSTQIRSRDGNGSSR